jgi:hypothetical protein
MTIPTNVIRAFAGRAAAINGFEAAFPIEIYAIHGKSVSGGAFTKPKPVEPQACLDHPPVSNRLRRPISSLEEAALSNGLSRLRHGS